MRILLPESFAEACALLAEAPERIALAGGTDLLVAWPQRFDLRDATFIDLSRLAELKSIGWAQGSLVLGAATTYWDVQSDAAVGAAFPLLAQAARSVGALQIQTRGTWAGNIVSASPAADGAAVLLAQEAVLELVSSHDREMVPLADFYRRGEASRRRPDQLVRSIRVPRREHSVSGLRQGRLPRCAHDLEPQSDHRPIGSRLAHGGRWNGAPGGPLSEPRALDHERSTDRISRRVAARAARRPGARG